MWQTVVILVLLAAVLVYVIRHYVRVFRSEVPSCSGCSGCCGAQSSARDVVEGCDCGERKTGLR